MGSYLQSHNSVKVAPRPALFQEALAGMVSSGGNSAGIGVEFGKLLPDELHLIGEAAVFELLLLFLGMAIESTSNIAAPRRVSRRSKCSTSRTLSITVPNSSSTVPRKR